MSDNDDRKCSVCNSPSCTAQQSCYLHNIALEEVHLVRASKEQHDVDFVPLYDSETVERLRAERDALQAFVRQILKHAAHGYVYSAETLVGLAEKDGLVDEFGLATPLLTGEQQT